MRVSPTITKGTFVAGSARFLTGNWSTVGGDANGFISVCVSASSGGNDYWACTGNSSAEL
jgi:hypothetical protein